MQGFNFYNFIILELEPSTVTSNTVSFKKQVQKLLIAPILNRNPSHHYNQSRIVGGLSQVRIFCPISLKSGLGNPPTMSNRVLKTLPTRCPMPMIVNAGITCLSSVVAEVGKHPFVSPYSGR